MQRQPVQPAAGRCLSDMSAARACFFDGFRTGTLFLIRTPDAFPPGYPDRAFADMKALGLSYAAWLETWNCEDGVLWISPKYPRSRYWRDEARDPLAETFAAADRHGLAFLPEAGVMHRAWFDAHPDAWVHEAPDRPAGRYGRIGLVPDAPATLAYFVDKYETLIERFRHHRSLQGICLPSENSVHVSYDSHTRGAYRDAWGETLPGPVELQASPALRRKVHAFAEQRLVEFFSRLAKHLKQKYGLAVMHYPLGLLSGHCHFQPLSDRRGRHALSTLRQVGETDLFNLQVHPTLDDNPYFFKAESEIIQALTRGRRVVADTHFYHEICNGKLPGATPKRFRDWVLGTLTPHGLSFFSYGFYELFQAAAVPVTFVSEIPAGADGPRIVFLHALPCLTESHAGQLETFLRQGGCAVVSGDCGPAFSRRLGLDVSEATGEFVLAEDGSPFEFTPSLGLRDHAESRGVPLYRWNDGSHAVTEMTIGTGRLIYIGASSALSEFGHHRRTALIGFLHRLVRRLSGELQVEIDAPYRRRHQHAYLSADIYRHRSGRAISLLVRNFGVETDAVEIRWRVPRHDEVHLVVDRRKRPRSAMAWSDGMLRVRMERIEDLALIALENVER